MDTEATAPIEALRRSAATWRRMPLRWHLIAVLLLALVAVARWSFLRSPAPRGDEVIYLKAFVASLEGGSPYDVQGFFYPPVFARAGAWLLATLGACGTVAVMRGANLLGLGFAFWLATAWLPASMARRWLVAALCLYLSPAVRAGLDLCNVSFVIVGLTLAALCAWPRRPLAAGAVLGAGVALKPIAAAVIPVLGVHRPRRGAGRDVRRHWSTAAAAAATATLLLLPISGLREMLNHEMVELAYARSFSLQRLLALFGIDVGQVALSLAVIALAAVAARRRPMSSAQLLCFAVAAISLATPLVWNHTLIVALPVEGLAVALAWHRRAEARNAPKAWARDTGTGRRSALRRWEPVLVALGVIMIHAGTTAGFDDLRPWLQAPLLLAVGLTPAAVCAYVWKLTGDLEVIA